MLLKDVDYRALSREEIQHIIVEQLPEFPN